jgi:SAM-dependent methyltransferase
VHPDFARLSDLSSTTTHSREPFFQIARKYYASGSKVLDVGAGNGDFAQLLGDEQVYLVDANPTTVESLKRRFPNSYCTALPDRMPFSDRFFDLIHTSHLVEHLQPAELYLLLMELDRCLAPGGFLVISAPLLWSGFYDDLSHVRPYNPAVFVNYLCASGYSGARTRPPASSAYTVVELVYRHTLVPLGYWNISATRIHAKNLLFKLTNWLRRHRLQRYEVTGYTVVLSKSQDICVSPEL